MLIDFVFIFTVVFNFLTGYRRGFTRMFVTLVFFVCSIAFVAQMYGYLEEIVFNSEFGKNVVENISTNITEKIEEFRTGVISDAPFLSSYLKDSGADNSLQKSILELSLKCLKSIVSIPLIIISFIILKIISGVVKRLVSKTRGIPIIGGFDSILGSLCGIIVGGALVCIMYFFACHLQFYPSVPIIKEQLGESLIVMLISDFIA